MLSYSIYRHHAAAGFGGSPPGPESRDDSWADDELRRDPQLLETIRPWLTLDFQANYGYELRDFEEGWSCFNSGGYIFVARHTLASPDRCLTCARAWPLSSLPADYDPAALIGRPEFFQPKAQPALPIPHPEMPWAGLLQSHRDAAVHFVSHVYAAMSERRPLIVVNENFRVGAPIHGLAGFARAALPREWRDSCQVRVYTRHPARFASDLKATIVVTLLDEVKALLEKYPDSTVLAHDGSPISGASADSTYGRMIVGRTREFPSKLFSFSSRFRPSLPMRAARDVYNLAAASGNPEWMEDLLRHWLANESNATATELVDWEELIEPGEWQQFSSELLSSAALADTARGNLPALRRGVFKELRRRGISLDHQADELWARAREGERAGTLCDCSAAELISAKTAARLALSLTTAEVWTALARDDLYSQLLDITANAAIPDHWMSDPPPGADIYAAVIHVLGHFRNSPDTVFWTRVAWGVLADALLRERPVHATSPPTVQLPDPVDVRRCLLLAELFYRAGWPGAGHRMQTLAALTDRNERRWLVYQVGKPEYWCLKNFVPPKDWPVDLAGTALFKRMNDNQLGAKLASVSKDLLEPGLVYEVDMRMQSQAESMTRTLLFARRWLEWRRKTELDALTLRDCAIEWLLSDLGSRRWEEWERVIEDLSDNRLTADEVEEMIKRRVPPWPWLAGREEEQAKQLVRIAADAGAAQRMSEQDASRRVAAAEKRYRRHQRTRVASLEPVAGPLPGPSPSPHQSASKPIPILYRAAVTALASGKGTDPCWDVVVQEARSGTARPHPLSAIAACVRRENADVHSLLDRHGWKTFKTVLARAPVLLEASKDDSAVLPALELAAVLRSDDPIANVAFDLIELNTTFLRGGGPWARALARGFDNLPRRSSRPHRRDFAGPSLALLRAMLSDAHPDLLNYLDDRVGPVVRPAGAPPVIGASQDSMPGAAIAAMTAALARGDWEHNAWNLAEGMLPGTSGGGHPFTLLADALAQTSDTSLQETRKHGWETLKGVVARVPALAEPAPEGVRPRLPIVYLASVLRPDLDAAAVARDLVLAKSDALYLRSPAWWRALFSMVPPSASKQLTRAVEHNLNTLARISMLKALDDRPSEGASLG